MIETGATRSGQAETAARLFGCTFGNYTDEQWTDRRTLSWQELTGILVTHKLGKKEGTCIVPAIFRGERRKKEDADQIDAAFLDSDSGATLEEITACV